MAHSGLAAGSTRLRDFAPQLHAHAAAMQADSPSPLTPHPSLPPGDGEINEDEFLRIMKKTSLY